MTWEPFANLICTWHSCIHAKCGYCPALQIVAWFLVINWIIT